MASPHHLQPRCATTVMMTVRTHELRGKLGIESTLGHSLSIFVHQNVVTRPLPLHTIKGEEGTLDQRWWHNKTTPCNGNVLSTHSSTRTHPRTETWEPSLSQPAYIPLLQALRCKATRAAASTGSRDVQPEPVYILCPPCTTSEALTRNFIHLSPSLDTPRSRTPTLLVFINAHKKDPQAHRYRYSFHPEVLNIISIGKHVSATKSMLNP
jgi:hypothetical protein